MCNHKTLELKCNMGNFDAKINIPDDCKTDLKWWTENISTQEKSIVCATPDITIQSDASLKGWGLFIPPNRLNLFGHNKSKESISMS